MIAQPRTPGNRENAALLKCDCTPVPRAAPDLRPRTADVKVSLAQAFM